MQLEKEHFYTITKPFKHDRMIPLSLQQMFASRMKATTVSVPSSHASIVSHPLKVFELIQAAAKVGANK